MSETPDWAAVEYEPTPDPDPRILELYHAAGRGDLTCVRALLDSDLMADEDNWLMTNALDWATSGSHLDTMQLLIERGASTHLDKYRAWSPLTTAVALSGVWPGWLGIRLPDSRPLELLLRAGAKYRIRDAVILNDLSLAHRLLDEGADPNAGAGEYHGPVLMTAARMGHSAMAALLLNRGAEVDGIDDLHLTPLVDAVERGYVAVARQLLKRGANPRTLNGYCRTLMTVAQNAGHQEMVDLLHEQPVDWEVLAVLHERADEPATLDALLRTDLPLLVRVADELVATRTVDHWAGCSPVDQKYFGGDRLAIHAARVGSALALAILFDRGAGHFYPVRDERSLLAEAAGEGHLDAVRLLLDRGADIHTVGRNGLTPLGWAMHQNRPEAVDLLQRAGATR